jgi:BED zinc finger
VFGVPRAIARSSDLALETLFKRALDLISLLQHLSMAHELSFDETFHEVYLQHHNPQEEQPLEAFEPSTATAKQDHDMKAQPSTKDLVRPVGRSSAVWQHFKVAFPQGSHPGVAVCDWCHKDVQHGSSTSNLASHLRVRHPQVVAGTDLAIPPPCLGANRKPRTRKPKAENLQTLFEDAFLKWAVATGECSH